MSSKKKKEPEKKKEEARPVASLQNRRARRDYEIEEQIEAGIVLAGSEVKSLRAGRANIADAYAAGKGGEIWLYNFYIAEYSEASRFNHEPRRARKLLLHQRQINKLLGQVKMKGYTLVPLSVFFNKRGMVKILLGLGKGRKEFEKRDVVKKREWERERSRLLKKG